jgi:hypothetical protein
LSQIWEQDLRRPGVPNAGNMAAEERMVAHSTLSKIIVYASVISRFVAAYLIYKRGEPLIAIARQTVTNPVGSLVSEVQNTI